MIMKYNEKLSNFTLNYIPVLRCVAAVLFESVRLTNCIPVFRLVIAVLSETIKKESIMWNYSVTINPIFPIPVSYCVLSLAHFLRFYVVVYKSKCLATLTHFKYMYKLVCRIFSLKSLVTLKPV